MSDQAQLSLLPDTVAFATKEIDGVTYQLMAMSPEKVIDHGNALLASVFGNAMAKAATSVGESEEALMMSVFSSVLMNMAHPTLKAAIAEMWKDAFADGLPLEKNWKTHFQGHTGRMVRFLIWALEAQFSDFFSSLVGVFKDAAARRKAQRAASATAKEKESSSKSETSQNAS